jgi:predicted RNase H-like nuclease (RuvC/YqgF family)
MTRDEIVTALRCCAGDSCEGCPYDEIFAVEDAKCIGETTGYAADLIENQQRHIEALMKANDSLKDAIARRDKQIEDMKQGMAQLAKAVAVKEENNGTTDTAYEDTGLTPGDIKELLDMAASKTNRVLRLKEELHTIKNELCQYCGKYKHAHDGACDGCRWREM